MNHDTATNALPALTADFLRSTNCLVDNVFADTYGSVLAWLDYSSGVVLRNAPVCR